MFNVHFSDMERQTRPRMSNLSCILHRYIIGLVTRLHQKELLATTFENLHLEALQYLHEKGECPRGEESTGLAAELGHLECLK